jgi:hypothetical protein
MAQTQQKSSAQMNKAQSRQRRAHERKRARYRVRMWAIFAKYGVDATRLGRKLRRLAREGKLRMS